MQQTKKKIPISSSITIFVGCLSLIICSFLIIKDIEFTINAEQIDCQIVEMERYSNKYGKTDYDIYVSYTYDGELYEKVWLSTYVIGMYEGKNIKVYCNPNNPEEIRLGEIEFIVYLIPIICGIIAICIGFHSIRKSKRIKQLEEVGETIYAVIESFERDTEHSDNAMDSYILICSYKDKETGKIYSFMHERLLKSQCDMYRPGDTVKVIVLPEDYSHYKIVL